MQKVKIGKLDSFLFFTFKFGKIISTVCLAVFFIGLILSAILIFNLKGSGFENPNFDTVKAYYDQQNTQQQSNVSQSDDAQNLNYIQEKIKVERNYKDIIKVIIKQNQLDPLFYDYMLKELVDIPDNQRSNYMAGLEKFMSDGVKYFRENGKFDNTINAEDIASTYKSMYQESLNKQQQSETDSKIQQVTIFGAAATSLLFFIIFLILPLLIKIEENTRPKTN